MTYTDFIRRTFTVVFITVGIVLGFIVLWSIRQFLLITFTGWVISVALDLPIARMQHWGIPKAPAALVTVFGLGLVIFLIFSLVFPPLISQLVDLVDNLPETTREAVVSYEDFYNDNSSVQGILPKFTLEDYDDLIDPDDGVERGEGQIPFDLSDIAGSAVPILGGIGSFVGDLLANFLIIVFITLYFLLDPIPYYKGVVYLVPRDREQRAVELLNNVRHIVVNWLGALIVSITAQATMVMITVGLIMQVPNALGLALLAGLSNIIPNLGFYLALIPVIVVTAAHDASKLPLVILFYIIGGEFEGKVITPRVVEHSLSLPAGLVLVFQLIAGAYLGFFGILLAVPILAIVMMLIKELYVFDALGKRGQLSELVENERGDLHLIKQNSLVADSE